MQKIILQSESDDKSTDDVLSWLFYLSSNTKIEKYFDKYLIDELKIEISNKEQLKIEINNNRLTDNNSFWYRRGQFRYKGIQNIQNDFINIEKNVYSENINPILNFLDGARFKNGINKFSDNHLNKLNVLHLCSQLDIKIPDTLITAKTTDVESFLVNILK